MICHIVIDFFCQFEPKVQSHISIYSWSPVLGAGRADYHSELSINLQKSLFEIQNNKIGEMRWITRLRTILCLFQFLFSSPRLCLARKSSEMEYNVQWMQAS